WLTLNPASTSPSQTHSLTVMDWFARIFVPLAPIKEYESTEVWGRENQRTKKGIGKLLRGGILLADNRLSV
ncbi:hypothetical protein Q0590_33230, partial [Rhodocytophaga aerolata]